MIEIISSYKSFHSVLYWFRIESNYHMFSISFILQSIVWHDDDDGVAINI